MSVLAVDIGGTNLRTMVFDSSCYRGGTDYHGGSSPTPFQLHKLPRNPRGSLDISSVAAVLRQQIDICRAEPGAAQVEAVGVSIAGTVDRSRRVVVRAMNLGLDDVGLAEMLEHAAEVPVVLETDSFAAGLAEARLGSGRGYDPVLFLTIGTGVGHAVISAGEVLRGARSGASVFGHICVEPNGVECYCGRRGCLCMYASGAGLAALAGSAGYEADGEAVGKASQRGEDWAREVIAQADMYLARALAAALSLMNPARVVIGGGAFAPDAERFARLQLGVTERVHASVQPIEIVPGRFLGSASLVGAGLVAEEAVVVSKRGDNAEQRHS